MIIARVPVGLFACVLAVVVTLALALYAMSIPASSDDQTDVFCSWTVNDRFPHDPEAFTQGLQWYDGTFYEGTGLYGESTLREVEVETGKVIRKIDLDKVFFGEGITLFEDRVYQLTWREQTAFMYRRDDFSEIKRFSYDGEGWGLTHDGNMLIMSDGSHQLRFLDPEDFSEQRRISVHTSRGPVTMLNELEFIDGAIFANVWQSDFIVRIDPLSGRVTGLFDFRGLLDPLLNGRKPPGVLNGIARDGNSGRLLITGKNWPVVFQVTPACP